MKNKKLITLLLAAIMSVSGAAVVLTTTACDGGQSGQGQTQVKKYKVTFKDEKGDVIATKEVDSGSLVEAADAASKAGYTISWVDADNKAVDFTAAISADATYTLKYTANTNTAYKVEHYFEDVDGAFAIDAAKTENLTGTTDATATATAKTAEHFTQTDNADALLSGAIKGDGSLVLKVYYAREKFAVKFDADGTVIDTKQVRYGAKVAATEIAVPEKDKTADKEFVLKHWSLTANGPAYNFDTVVEGEVVLHAVYEEVARKFELNATLENDLYYLTDADDVDWSAKTDFDFTKVPYGTEFGFKIGMSKETDGTPAVKVTTTGDDGVPGTETITADADGYYLITVNKATSIEIEGLKAAEYEVSVQLSEMTYTNAWAKPYSAMSDVSFEIAKRDGEVTTADNVATGLIGKVTLTAGAYDIRAFVWNGTAKKYISKAVTVEVGRDLATDGKIASDKALLLAPSVTINDNETAVVSDEGYITDPNGKSFNATFDGFSPLSGDFAVTATFDQIMDDKGGTVHEDLAVADPSLGFRFYDSEGNELELPLFDAGAVRIWKNGEKLFEYRSTMSALGSLNGKLEWGDCYRHAAITYVKTNGYLYALISANGNAGSINLQGQPGTSSAPTHTDFMPFYIDIATGTMYVSKDLNPANADTYDKFATFQDDSLTSILSNVASAKVLFGFLPEVESYTKISGWGFTTDKTVLDGYNAKLRPSFSLTAPAGLDVTVNGDIYSEARMLALGEKLAITFDSPDGKVVASVKDNGEGIKYSISGSSVSVTVDTYKNYGPHNIVIELKDGQYTETTVFSGTVSIAEKFGTTYNLDNCMVRFTNADGATVKATYDKATKKYSATLAKGLWDLYATNGIISGKVANITSGLSTTFTQDIVLDGFAVADNTAITNKGLIYNAETNTFGIQNAEWPTQETAVSNITFKPSEEVLEFGYTITGMTTRSGNGRYPWIGMVVKNADGDGGALRFVNCNAGDELSIMTGTDDFLSRAAVTEKTGGGEGGVCGWEPFGNATGYYCFDHADYKVSMKVRIDGYSLSAWAKAGEMADYVQIKFFINGADTTVINVYDFYNQDTFLSMRPDWDANYGPRKNFVGGLYSLDKECVFGLSERFDAGTESSPNAGAKFSDVWFNVTAK